MWDFAGRVAEIAVIDMALSGDNAVVIGMAAKELPPAQRARVIRYGVAAAIALRVTLAALASLMLRVPLLQAAGGLVLFWIAYKLMRPTENNTTPDIAPVATMRDSIRVIILADLSMSLDNVLAIGGVSHGDLGLLLFGLAFSIPFLLISSSVIAGLLNRYPWLNWLGIAILVWTAAQMIWEDPIVHRLVTGRAPVHSVVK